jgi:Outer membrane protein/protective antigen OMA87
LAIKYTLFIFLFFILTNSIYSQTDSVQTSNAGKLVAEAKSDRDIRDVIKLSHKKNTDVDTVPQIGKNFFSIVPALGYTLQTGFAGIISANLAYYNSSQPSQKISSLSTSFTYSQYSQSIVPFTANIWTKGNKLNFITDCRFIDYPSDIYGLGGKRISVDSNADIGYTIDFSGIKIHQTVMLSVAKNMYVGLGYYYDQFWGIKALDSLKRNVVRLLNRDLGKTELASGLAFRYLYDSRLNQINPDQGLYVNVVFRDNFRFLASDDNWASLQTDIRGYTRFPKRTKNVSGFWALAWTTVSKTSPPYLLLPSTGWDDQYNSGRGYVQGRFRGDNMYYFEDEYRFRISHNGLFGGVLFTNFQYFSGELSKKYEAVRVGYGLGLRIKLNKFSGANLCIDYGFGQNGSQGFFVNLGEVF